MEVKLLLFTSYQAFLVCERHPAPSLLTLTSAGSRVLLCSVKNGARLDSGLSLKFFLSHISKRVIDFLPDKNYPMLPSHVISIAQYLGKKVE